MKTKLCLTSSSDHSRADCENVRAAASVPCPTHIAQGSQRPALLTGPVGSSLTTQTGAQCCLLCVNGPLKTVVIKTGENGTP